MPETEVDPSTPLVAYYRVSTKRQGLSGLGLEAQQAAVARHVHLSGATLLAAYTEIETGTHARRPQLTAALALCRAENAVLVIAKLDRLARNVAFTSALMDSGLEFRALDMPLASRLHVHVMSAFAEHEAKLISQRTKDALAAAKARGTRLGRPANLTDASRRASIVSRQAAVRARHQLILPLVKAWRKARWSLRHIAAELTTLQVQLPKGGCSWRPAQVARVVALANLKPRRVRKPAIPAPAA